MKSSSLIKLTTLIKKLPYEIIEIIRRFTYLHQSHYLLSDITNYYQTKKIALVLYYDSYKDNLENCPNDDLNWFANDIIIYMNNRQPTMFGYVPKYYDIMYRSYVMDTFSKIIKYSECISNGKVIKEINVFWGLLTPKERKEMIKMFYSPQKIELASRTADIPNILF